MINIRELTEEDMQQAMELKVMCWTEELAGKAENTLSVSQELDFWANWKNTAQEHEDIRLLIGAFEEDKMLGVAFCSFAETYDIPEKGIELNGLWVYPDHRGRGISLMMIIHALDFYLAKGMEKIVIYNPHYSPSNGFYHKHGAQVVRQEYQMEGMLLVDIFLGDMILMKNNMEKSLKKYKLMC
ncbi:GNAT family N-acetyltransferase [Alkaliphilus transvaalensis]|uniref:GNAT family N-acetyltransferase n=1 Tax=Alkaliphilus transvaalensis TaxID=114628 RepID=UPI00047D8E3A|nr:GNAT family N-acetyltransferase [Alkaliphilus transvaalensis]